MKGRPDIYQEVTDRIIEALEAGTVPWRKPWRSVGGPLNLNGRPYRGINVFLLELMGHGDPRWGTFRMVKAHGGHVRKGERARGSSSGNRCAGRTRTARSRRPTCCSAPTPSSTRSSAKDCPRSRSTS